MHTSSGFAGRRQFSCILSRVRPRRAGKKTPEAMYLFTRLHIAQVIPTIILRGHHNMSRILPQAKDEHKSRPDGLIGQRRNSRDDSLSSTLGDNTSRVQISGVVPAATFSPCSRFIDAVRFMRNLSTVGWVALVIFTKEINPFWFWAASPVRSVDARVE